MSTSFADLGVSSPVADALRSRGITDPFPIQKMVLEDVLEGHDSLVKSPTGSGKTLAFGLPLIERIDSNGPRPAALVLAPTRELASQIVDELDSLCHARALKIAAVYGGVGINPQIKAVRTAHIVVATPGRLEDLIQRRAIDLSKVRMLVLDEADRMLDMGFRPPVDRIVSLLPRKRQTLFFSATLEGQAGEIAREYTYKPRVHDYVPEIEGPTAIQHEFALIGSQAGKIDALVSELTEHDRGRTLVFVRTKRGCDRLVKKLGQQGIKSLAMHGDKSQGQRQKALARFERGDLMTLVATDVAARGIDVAEITNIVNFDIPEDRETYTHRTGRTGRAGAEGHALTFVLADQRSETRAVARELDLVREYEKGVGSGGGSNGNGRPSGNGSRPQGGGSRNGNRPGKPGKGKGGKSRSGGYKGQRSESGDSRKSRNGKPASRNGRHGARTHESGGKTQGSRKARPARAGQQRGR
jgi:ATP-dependent RNA helicase RhlE